MIFTKKFLPLIAATLISANVSAQENEFDLSAQRSESQDVLRVPGQKLDHGGLIINPTPHQITVDRSATLNIAGGLKLNDKQAKFGSDLGFLKMGASGVNLTVDFGAQIAQQQGVKPATGAYVMTINAKGITITGYDERGAFYGLQTLRQVVESPVAQQGELPYMTVNDYPDLKYRGVVEGFYGTPWSHKVRMSLIDFYGKFKLNCYLYGPKDDPYHSCPNWRLPYPEKEAQNIKELVEACKRNRVDFVWAIHPGQDIKWNEEDYNNLLGKFNMMYDFGVRSFAIFFDDISGEGTNPEKQTALLNRLDREFVKVKGDVSSLIVCPTDYSKLWANPTPQGSLVTYGKTLDPSIEVFWTGDAVCSDMTKSTMDWFNSRVQRPGLFWWNYPVTDYVSHIMMQGPVYGLDSTLTAGDLAGLVSNPMEHGEASKLALYGVADYAWNVADYNPIDNWERGIEELTPQAKEAYRTFAIHSADTETGYRRDESWETETFRIANFNQAQYDALMKEFEKVEQTPAQMDAGCANKALLSELRPWLVEFGKLGTRGKKAMELIALYNAGDKSAFWAKYVDNLMSSADLEAYQKHKSGTMKLQPFYENAMDDMLGGFYTQLTGQLPATYRGIGSFANLSTTMNKLMFDNDAATFYTSGTSQNGKSWIGADLGAVCDVAEVNILQGRNSKDDVDYFDHAILEYSADGKTWTPLTDSLVKQYEINWHGTPVRARYVRLKRLESSKQNWAAIRSFEINPVRVENLGFAVTADDMGKALYAFDKHPGTSYINSGVLAFGLPKGAKVLTVLAKLSGAPVNMRQLSARGKVLVDAVVDAPFTKVMLVKGAAKVEIEGSAEIFEIIPQ